MREETREIYLTAEEYYRLDLERLPFGELEDTPIMDKIRKAGIEPLSFTMSIKISEDGEGVYLSDTVGILTWEDQAKKRIKKFYQSFLKKNKHNAK